VITNAALRLLTRDVVAEKNVLFGLKIGLVRPIEGGSYYQRKMILGKDLKGHFQMTIGLLSVCLLVKRLTRSAVDLTMTTRQLDVMPE